MGTTTDLSRAGVERPRALRDPADGGSAGVERLEVLPYAGRCRCRGQREERGR